MAASKHKNQVQLYNIWFDEIEHPVSRELYMIQKGGRWEKKNGEIAGEGMFFHFKKLQQLIHPEKAWHKWNDLLLKEFVSNRIITVVAPASSGKTREGADYARMCYYAWPDCITVMLTSTEKDRLEERVWGEIKAQHKLAKQRFPFLPGNLIESKQRLVTDEKTAENEGRDFRNGMVGLPTKKGGTYVGLGAFSGTKNKRILLIADEASLMPRVFVDAISNLNKNAGFQGIVLGNPKATDDALGIMAEPSAKIGGWDGGIDQTGPTKVWETRFPNSVCVQLVGSDSPNHDVPEDAPIPFPFLITRKAIEADIAFYGKDSVQFAMMDEGRFPRGEGSRRILTRNMCLKFGAHQEAIWKDEKRTRIGFLDAAYSAVGGDRSIFGELQFGPDVNGKQILALISTILVPINRESPDIAEEQIAKFCQAECISRNIPADNFFFDSTGRGSLALSLARIWSPHVVGIEFGGRPSDRPVSSQIPALCKDYYDRKVSELWFTVRLIVMASQFRGMTDDVMFELGCKEWGIIGQNRTAVEDKAKTKEKVGRSPDLADALVAGCAGAIMRGFSIANTANRSTPSRTSDWLQKAAQRAKKLRQSHQLIYR